MELREGYKNSEVGVIPEDWQIKELGEILKVIGGGAFKSRDASQSGVKWLKISNVDINQTNWDDASFLPIELIKDNENFLLKEGDYVIALTRPILDRKLKIARLNLQDVPALLNQRVGKIEVESQTNIDYTYYLFQKFETISGLLQSMAGTDPPNLSNKGIYGIKCGVPPTKAEQTAIATALSDTDALINSLEKLIAKKRNIKQGAMHQLLKPKEGWEVKKLGEIVKTFQLGGNYPNGETVSNFPLIKMGNIQRGFISTDKVEYILSNFNPDKKDKLNFGDVLFNTRNTLELVGKVSIWRNELSEAYFNSNLMRLEFNSEFISSNFFMNLLFNTKDVISKLKDIATGTTSVAAIYTRDLLKIELPIPKKEEQTRIATILSDMDAEIQALETKLEKYRKIKLGMMQNLLTGKIRLV